MSDFQTVVVGDLSQSAARYAVHQRLELLTFAGSNLAEETRVRLRQQQRPPEQQRIIDRVWHCFEVQGRTEAARQSHLGGGDRQASFAQIMTGTNASLTNGLMDGSECTPGLIGLYTRYATAT